MMQLLLPLGLLGLVGILALILIYIIKPNYQTKHISTTFVWKLSLKYRKKRLPTSKVRNIILFICQILVLTLFAGIMAKPAIVYERDTGENDVIAILDSSASMYAGSDGETRFSRALDEIRTLSSETMRSGGYVSLIIADNVPAYAARRVSSAESYLITEQLDSLEGEEGACSYGEADIPAAISLTEEVLAENPSAKIYLYTDTQFNYVPENINIVSVYREKEWNAAVLDATAELVDGFYQVTVRIAVYGRDTQVNVKLDVTDANAENSEETGLPISAEQPVFCDSDAVKTVIFREDAGADTDDVVYSALGEKRFFSYRSLHISVTTDEDDSFAEDNNFDLYGGQKELVRVLYASSDPNPFFTTALDTMKNLFEGRWDLEVTEVPMYGEVPESGYDLYFYEHLTPRALPVDGVVVLCDPQDVPGGAGFSIRRTVTSAMGDAYTLEAADTSHPLLRYFMPDYVEVTAYTRIAPDAGQDFEVVLNIGADPLLLLQNEGSRKLAVLPFSLHYSTLPLLPEWTVLVYNIIDYFLPSTVDKTAFAVDEEIVINDRGPSVTYSKYEDPLTEFPATLKFSTPGTYTLEQELYFTQKRSPEIQIYVKIPSAESNIWAVEDVLDDPYRDEVLTDAYDDLLVYLAAALVALLFLEWILQSLEGR